MKDEIRSETGHLEKVIIHAPCQNCHGMITPEMINPASPEYILFDDIIHVPFALKEHDIFASVLSQRAQVIQFEDLLLDILKDESLKRKLIYEEISLIEDLGDRAETLLEMNEVELANLLISGHLNGDVFFNPSPNLIFTRDVGAVVGNAFIVCSAASFDSLDGKSPRRREMTLMKFIAKNHSLFENYRIVDINEKREQRISLEGGDFIVIDKDTLMVGVSERTKEEAINLLTQEIFKEGFKRIVKVDLPKNHGSMHLDTVFTMINHGECVVFKDIVHEKMDLKIVSPEKEISFKDKNLIEVLEFLGINLKIYCCGGNDRLLSKREQWTDGANILAISPGVLVSYDRNCGTCSSLSEGGYEIVSAEDFCRNSAKYLDGRKIVITIPSGELSRGRGGPRCMSMPIGRSNT